MRLNLDKKMPDELKISRVKCIRCGKKTELAKTESRLKDGVLVVYCYNQKHRKIKMRVVFGKNIPRVVRKDRLKKTKEYEEEFSLKNLRCVCGHKIQFDRFGSYQAGGRIQGYCFNNMIHRITLQVLGKLVKDEPTCDEFFEIIIRPYAIK